MYDNDDDGPSMGEEAQFEMALKWGNPYSDNHHDDDEEDKVCYADELEAETDKAWGILGTDGKIVWLPKSQVTMDKFKTTLRFRVPAWLAKQKDTLEFDG